MDVVTSIGGFLDVVHQVWNYAVPCGMFAGLCVLLMSGMRR